jgi:hypothetical protein
LAIESRRQHPHTGIDDDELIAGSETEYYGGCNQRACHIRNGCMTAYMAAIILHLDPNNPDIGSDFLKAETDDGLGERFFRLETHRDGQVPADPFELRRGSITDTSERPRVEWHSGTHAYFHPFASDYFGHVVFDDLFGSFMAFRSLGFEPAVDDLRLLVNKGCESAPCSSYYSDWASGLFSTPVLVRPDLPPDALHCFDGLVVGVGQFLNPKPPCNACDNSGENDILIW